MSLKKNTKLDLEINGHISVAFKLVDIWKKKDFIAHT